MHTSIRMRCTGLGWVSYEMARWFHFWITMSFLGFFAVHIVQVILAGWNNFRAMVSGKEIQPVVVPSVEGERRSWR